MPITARISATIGIRNFNDSDLETIAALYNDARKPIDCFVTDPVTATGMKMLLIDEEIQLATMDGRVIGFVSVWKPEKFIHHLYVSPEHQKRGVAKALIAACVARYGLPLSLKSLVENTNACQFYERNLWIVTETGKGSDGVFNYYWLR